MRQLHPVGLEAQHNVNLQKAGNGNIHTLLLRHSTLWCIVHTVDGRSSCRFIRAWQYH
jgi:hypothetical protein